MIITCINHLPGLASCLTTHVYEVTRAHESHVLPQILV